jgi:hypothetical protein
MNKYEKWYNQITENAKHRTLDGYKERHHIIPRSLGGADTQDNLAELTAREHFICHWLLTKFTSGESKAKMILALLMMKTDAPYQQRYHTKITARVYENIREEVGRINSERNKGRVQPLHEKQNQIAAIIGRKRSPFSEEWKQKMSEAHKGEKNHRYGVAVSNETKAKMRAKALGRKQSEETIRKKAEAVRGSKREKKLCTHCDQLVAVNGYARWHGDRCRQKG